MAVMPVVLAIYLLITGINGLPLETNVQGPDNLSSMLPTSIEATIVDTITGYLNNQPRIDTIVVNPGLIHFEFGIYAIGANLVNVRIKGINIVVVNSIMVSEVPPYFEFDFTFPKLQIECENISAQIVLPDGKIDQFTLDIWAELLDTRMTGRAQYVISTKYKQTPIRVVNVEHNIIIAEYQAEMNAIANEEKITVVLEESDSLVVEIDFLRIIYEMELKVLMDHQLQLLFNNIL